MRKAVWSILVLIFLARESRLTAAEIDFCDGDPRLLVTTNDCTDGSLDKRKLALLLPMLDSNINHALHDKLWALSYYLVYCAGNFEVTLMFANEAPFMPSLCHADSPSHAQRRLWPRCVAYFTAVAAGVKPDNIIWAEKEDWWRRNETKCIDKVVAMGVKTDAEVDARAEGTTLQTAAFRKTSWYGRDCTSLAKKQSWQEDWECAGRFVSAGLVPLPSEPKMRAIQHLRKSVLDAVYSKPENDSIGPSWMQQREDAKIRTVVYGREDAPRRWWSNVNETYKLLQKDPRLFILHVQAMPRGFAQQVKLFAWADVLISNHGAGLANSVFMGKGTEVLEVIKACQRDVAWDRWVGKDWTSWHAFHIGLSLSYLQCTEDREGGYQAELLRRQKAPVWNDGILVNASEVSNFMQPVIERQTIRVRNLTGTEVLGKHQEISAEVSVQMVERHDHDVMARERKTGQKQNQLHSINNLAAGVCGFVALAFCIRRQRRNNRS